MNKGRVGASRSLGVASGLAILTAVLLLAAALLDSTLDATTSDSFCLSCHEMAVNIGGEFEHTLWLPGSEERHASCSECHLPQEFVPRLRRKLRAGRELYHHLIGTLDTPERFEARRMVMARAVWSDLQSNQSGECTACHRDDDEEQEEHSAAARAYHEHAAATGVACTGCHKGIAHPLPLPAPGESGHGDEGACLECHEAEEVEPIWRISHADPTGLGETPPSEQCGDCHGAGSTHSRSPLARAGLSMDAAPSADASGSRDCIECHREGPRVDWDVHAHGSAEAACGSCHRMHPSKGAAQLAVGRDAACTKSCHTWIDDVSDTATDSAEASCTSCHDPHLPPETSRCESCHRMDPASLAEQSAEARGFHERGERERIHCGECHKGIIHKSPHAELMETSPASL
jgi:nitrate/TMAO reductase-like tetraheme cytochrome c subunit